MNNQINPDALISFEQAERFLNENRPKVLKELDEKNPQGASDRKEARFQRVQAQLLREGNKLPVSVAHAETLNEPGIVVAKTLKDWQNYILKAEADAIGWKSSEIK